MAVNANSKLLKLLYVLGHLTILCASQDFDFFYFVQQWPGSYCDTKSSCCYPTGGKPAAAFGIHGLWPNYISGGYPSNCDPDSPFDQTKVADLAPSLRANWPTLACPSNNGTNFWKHEWEKHGTCSESVLDQHSYFSTSLSLQRQVNLVQILANSGIRPDGGMYSLGSIKKAIKDAVGHTPWIGCNVDADGTTQLYEVYLCVDSSASGFIECPVFPNGRCASSIQFPYF